MFTLRFILTLFTLVSLTGNAFAKKEKVDEINVVQQIINNAYEQGYVDAAPFEMSLVEKKVIEARALRDKRKKKAFEKLIEQIKADLDIVEKRYQVNDLYQKLKSVQQQNMQSTKMLDELKGQL